MNVFITGGSGFVGRHLSRFLWEKGCTVVSIGRSQTTNDLADSRLRHLSADTTKPGEWQKEVANADVIINLAGVNIFGYWTKKYKQAIYDSRIFTTRNLVNALPKNSDATLISASALGFYGNRGDDVLNEQEPAGSDFLAKVCEDWENEAFRAGEKGARVLITRFGVVADKSGGAMKMMIPPFRFFVGGPLGNGLQFFPWIHLHDLIHAIWHLIEQKELKGTYNFCAPNPIRNRDLAKTIGNLLRRPSFLMVPGFAIRWVIGELGSMVLFSQRGTAKKLIESGFRFNYPSFRQALEEILA